MIEAYIHKNGSNRLIKISNIEHWGQRFDKWGLNSEHCGQCFDKWGLDSELIGLDFEHIGLYFEHIDDQY